MMPAVSHLRITNRVGFPSRVRCISTVDIDKNCRFPQETGVWEAVEFDIVIISRPTDEQTAQACSLQSA